VEVGQTVLFGHQHFVVFLDGVLDEFVCRWKAVKCERVITLWQALQFVCCGWWRLLVLCIQSSTAKKVRRSVEFLQKRVKRGEKDIHFAYSPIINKPKRLREPNKRLRVFVYLCICVFVCVYV